MWRFPLSGAVAGVVSAVGFAALHALVISDIWWSVVPMASAGALCGACVAWSYRVIVGIVLVYAAVFAVLEWRSLEAGEGQSDPALVSVKEES